MEHAGENNGKRTRNAADEQDFRCPVCACLAEKRVQRYIADPDEKADDSQHGDNNYGCC